MKNHRLVLPLTLFAPALLAQEHTITIRPQGEKPLRYTIESSVNVESENKMLVDGEEMAGRGGRGGRGGAAAPGGTSATQQKIVFVDAGSWRQYETLEAKVLGWDGENERTVTGDLQGKKVTFTPEPAVVGEGDEATPMPAAASRGLPRKIDFSGLAPNQPLDAGGTYEIGNGLKQALASVVHPIRAGRPEGAGPGRRGQRGEGGEGDRGERGDRGGRGERGDRGGRQGRGGNLGMFGGTDNLALQILTAEGTEPKLTGKLVKVENDLATIEISGRVSGKGDPQKLGIAGPLGMGAMGMRGGRRGGGEGGERPQAAGDGTVQVDVQGTLVVDLANNTLKSLLLQGKLESSSHVEWTMETRDGGAREFEQDRKQKGDFKLSVACSPAD
ncbi:MAG TPA: hypothetical protein VK081_09765 [Planctomycetota bacterium]|nr:hypothetical protein [Planctomycetota bacterium]